MRYTLGAKIQPIVKGFVNEIKSTREPVCYRSFYFFTPLLFLIFLHMPVIAGETIYYDSSDLTLLQPDRPGREMQVKIFYVQVPKRPDSNEQCYICEF